MAEGAEETESNSNNSNADIPAMLGTVLPCEAAITASLGGMKREFDASTLSSLIGGLTSHLTAPSSPPSQLTQIQTSSSAALARMTATSSSSSSCSSSSSSSSTSLATAATTAAVSSLTGVTVTKSPTRSSSMSPSSTAEHLLHQQQPLNMKSEDYDKDIKIRSPSIPPEGETCTADKDQTINLYKNLSSGSCDDRGSSPHEHAKAVAAAAAQAHLNGTMQDMINLQKLQNFATLQQSSQSQHHHQQQQQQQPSPSSIVPPVAAALASLQGLAGLTSAVALNSPLNLSVGSTSTLSSSTTTANNINNNKPHHGPIGSLTNPGGNSLVGVGVQPAGATQMPQLILASGQLVQGVQGAQLLIPTSQGIAVQTILTIPVSQQINTNEQFLQSFAALNTGAAAAAAAAAFSAPPPPPPMAPSPHSQQLLKPNLFSTGVQQLLAALHPELFAAAASAPPPDHHHAKSLHMQQLQKQQQAQHMHHAHHHQPQHHAHALHQTDTHLATPKVELTPASHLRDTSPTQLTSSRHLRSPTSPCAITQLPKQSPTRLNRSIAQIEKSASSTPPAAIANCYSSPSGSQMFRSHSPASLHHQMTSSSATSTSSSHHSHQTAPSAATVLSSINRLTSTNGELTITKSHGPTNHSMSAASSSSPSPASMHQSQQQQQQQQPSHSQQQPQSHHHHHQHQPHHSLHHSPQQPSMKMSPSMAMQQISPSGTDNSTTDLLVDSPNEPTINQATSNVVDGIDLDEIKEFAKAFKLRRLSLGLTQTQVGQALSVTEGPAYSQSAICSALAAQMYAAQLSSQQQNMFEKLDITPKSAQKIKPVLERWMKEAEESHWNRYKSGQNHLTDFIGVEPSKKRKRRTSFTPQALELLNAHFERNTHPSGTEITGLAHQLGYEREVIRIWFCNKRQALKNTVRMMSKGMV